MAILKGMFVFVYLMIGNTLADEWQQIIADRVFDDRRGTGGRGALCPSRTVSFVEYTWISGGIRPDYYLDKGRMNDFRDCMAECERLEECYFATLTSSGYCWLLTTRDRRQCDYIKRHFGRLGERCDQRNPCRSAYKVCECQPHCTLVSIQRRFCETGDSYKAVTECGMDKI